MPYYTGHFWIHQGDGKYVEIVKALKHSVSKEGAIEEAIKIGRQVEAEKKQGPVTDYKIMRGRSIILTERPFPREDK